jgi:hypothetical protein
MTDHIIFNPGDKVTLNPDLNLPISDWVVVHDTLSDYVSIRHELYGVMTISKTQVTKAKLQ